MKALLVFKKNNSFSKEVWSLDLENYFASFDLTSRSANFLPDKEIIDSTMGVDFISRIMENNKFDIIIFSDELIVKETASYFAGKYNFGLIAHSKEFLFKENNIIGIVPGWNNVNAEVTSNSNPKLLILKSRSIVNLLLNNPCGIYLKEPTKVKLLSNEKIVENPLKSAKIIVGVGRGVERNVLPRVLEFARLIGAEVGCTRPVADSGLLPPDKVIGDSGVDVSPDVYIALGISGAIQHIESVNANYTIAINSDAHARIFQKSNLSINQKIEEVIDKLLVLISIHLN
jgi:electron transfer flavoprotein alpha subunit